MIKKFLKVFLALFILFTLFSFWMSPRLGGLIPMGKEGPDQKVEVLHFDTAATGEHSLAYNKEVLDSNLTQLRLEYQLDTLVRNCTTEFEKVIKVQSWVQSRWQHDGSNAPEFNNARYILAEAQKGKRFRCVEYSIVAGQCLAALGLTVRNLGLMTKDISEVKSGGGHAVNEVYLADLKKWVLIDPQYDVITTYEGVPLNAVELQDCIANKKDFGIINPNRTITKEGYIKWIGPYLYYFYTTLDGKTVGIWDRIAGNKKQLTLYAKGAEQPPYFQKIFRYNNSYFTHAINDFYPTIH